MYDGGVIHYREWHEYRREHPGTLRLIGTLSVNGIFPTQAYIDVKQAPGSLHPQYAANAIKDDLRTALFQHEDFTHALALAQHGQWDLHQALFLSGTRTGP